jgi:hypothetical protein
MGKYYPLRKYMSSPAGAKSRSDGHRPTKKRGIQALHGLILLPHQKNISPIPTLSPLIAFITVQTILTALFQKKL